ncbi:Leucine-rich repeat protein FLOR 1 [Bienertia sinuspersici]
MSHNHLILVSLLFVLFVNLPHSLALRHPDDKEVLLRIKRFLGNPPSLSSWDPNTDYCDGWKGVMCNFQGRVHFIAFHQAQDIHGPIPPFLDHLPYLDELSFLYLPNLSGPIPPYISKLTNLTRFSIHETKINGPIPKFLGQFTKLNYLSFTSNKLTGPVPNFLHPLKKLIHLFLTSNLLTGQISEALANVPNSVNFLDLSSNQLCGQIPNSIAPKLQNLHLLYLKSNHLSGSIPTSLGLLPKLQALDLSENYFKGSIPKSLGQTNIGYLFLSQNKLTGDASFLFEKNNTRIISVNIAYNLLKFDFTNVVFAETLGIMNISHNMIYGSLPEGFGQLQPRFVDVSYNQLCGPIPNGENFESANLEIFAYNKCLCGGPLPDCQ